MILIINTADEGYIEIALVESGELVSNERVDGKYHQSEKLLTTIVNTLGQLGKTISDIKGISVVSGPGGFTAIRVGVATANALAYAMGIPVIGISLNDFSNIQEMIDLSLEKIATAQLGSIVMPEYGREPNIT